MTKVKLGADPELFLKLGHEYVSAYGILPGTKEEPYKVEGGAVQVDGMAFEFNIDPAETEDQFNKNIELVLIQGKEMVKKVDKGLKFDFTPFAHFRENYFKDQPEDAKRLGCDPDYNAIGSQQVPPEDLQDAPFRTAAGHVHIGWTENMRPYHPDHFNECMRVAKCFQHLDLYSPKTLLEQKRVKYYGAPGSFRPKSYGVELRSPSNRWVKHEKTRRQMFRDTMERFSMVKHVL